MPTASTRGGLGKPRMVAASRLRDVRLAFESCKAGRLEERLDRANAVDTPVALGAVAAGTAEHGVALTVAGVEAVPSVVPAERVASASAVDHVAPWAADDAVVVRVAV